MDKENLLHNEILAEKIDHLKTITERFEAQNDKDHNSLIAYQKKQNGKVKTNTENIAKIKGKLGFTTILLPILTSLIGALTMFVIVNL